MTLAGNYIKGDDIEDPEKAMQRDLEKKRTFATRTAEYVKTEFVREYLSSFGELPDLTNPIIDMFYNGWLAAQGKREWLTPEEQKALREKQLKSDKRKKTMAANREKRKGLK